MRSNPQAIATHSGLRGRPGIELTDDVVCETVNRFAALVGARRENPAIAVACDGRPGGDRLADVVTITALEAGVDVVDLGVVSTPAAKIAARTRKLVGAVVVTGSHLGPDWNGLKLAAAPLFAPIDVRSLPRASPAGRANAGRLTRVTSAAAEHADAVCSAVSVDRIRAAGLTLSFRGGAGSSAQLTLARLARLEADCALGIELDADGDRLQLRDEDGDRIASDATLALVARARRPRVLVKGADTSRIVDRVVASEGGSVVCVPTGELHLVRGVVAHRAGVAGEGNGGVIVPEVGLARDGVAAAAVILELVATTRRPLSQLVAELPATARRRSAIPCADDATALAALQRLAARVGAPPVADPTLGVAVERRGGAWALIRMSATERVLRLTAEGPTPAVADELHEEMRALAASP